MTLLFVKDLRAIRYSLLPALLLGLPLLLLFQLPRQIGGQPLLPWHESFWLSFFLGSVWVFYRSFSQEHRSQNFGLYRGLRFRRPAILWSQALIHVLSLTILGVTYALVSFLFWSPAEPHLLRLLASIVGVSLALAPLGTALGLFLQLEREFLFSLFFLPLTVPAFMAAQTLSLEGFSWSWGFILIAYAAVGGFVSSLLFEFFFDELSQNH